MWVFKQWRQRGNLYIKSTFVIFLAMRTKIHILLQSVDSLHQGMFIITGFCCTK